MGEKAKVSVLMSTYNGERYIREQLDSILAQKEVEIFLLIRDDGSTDGTKQILNEYMNYYSNVQAYFRKNIGVGRSFFSLLKNAPDADFYAFSDQDDVWLEDKLARAAEMLSGKSGRESAILYASNQIVVDKEKKITGKRYIQDPDYSFYKTLSRNVLSGCTMVMNKRMREEIMDHSHCPSSNILETRMHDTWCMIVAHIVGQVVYDREGRILYRQHDNNVVGAGKKTFREYIDDKMRRLISRKNKGIRSQCARELLAMFDKELGEERKRKLTMLANCHSIRAAVRLCRDDELRSMFDESRFMIVVRAALGWI